MSLLLMLTHGLPLLMLLLLAVKPMQARIVSLLAAAPLPGFLLALASGRDLDWSLRMPGGWAFELDRPAAMLLLASALIWSAAGACASKWLKGRPDAPRFAMWWLLTLWGSLGVFAAADLASGSPRACAAATKGVAWLALAVAISVGGITALFHARVSRRRQLDHMATGRHAPARVAGGRALPGLGARAAT